MSKCDILFNQSCSGKVMSRNVSDECSICNPGPVENRAEDACVCPPLGEPRDLTIVAPVVFDECGINLCKVVKRCALKGDDIDSVQLRVIDIDYNLKCDDGSEVDFIPSRPNCARVKLSNICVKFAVKLLDRDCNIIDTFCMSELFLPPSEDDDSFDEETNPTSVTVDLYTPYGLSYIDKCSECIPTINFLGFIESCEDKQNNSLRQGIGSQALAKVVRFDNTQGLAAIGLTLYLKVIYFIQYRIPHRGLCVPPKCVPIEPIIENSCKDFVEGDLLEQSIQPLELCQRPKTISDDCGCGCEGTGAVEDPTPAQPTERGHRKDDCSCRR